MAITTTRRAALIAHLINDHRFDNYGIDYTARLNNWSDTQLNHEHDLAHGGDSTDPRAHLNDMDI